MNFQDERREEMSESQSAPPPPYQASEIPSRPAPPRRSTVYGEGRTKSPVLAALMSLMPGLGQCYVGYYQVGFIIILVIVSVITILIQEIEPIKPFFGLFP